MDLDIGDHAPRPKPPEFRRSYSGYLILIFVGLIGIALLPIMPLSGTLTLGSWVGLTTWAFVTRMARLVERLQRIELATKAYQRAAAQWEVEQAEWLAKETRFRLDWYDQECQRDRNARRQWEEHQQQWELEAKNQWKRNQQEWEVNQKNWQEYQQVDWEARMQRWERNQRKWESRLPEWEQRQHVWEIKLRSDYQLQQQIWNRKQQAWESELMAEWLVKHQQWQEALQGLENHNQHVDRLQSRWIEDCRIWEGNQAAWENATRSRWGMEHRIWKADHLRWLDEADQRRALRDSLAAKLVEMEANHEAEGMTLLKSITSYRPILDQTKARLNLTIRNYETKKLELSGKEVEKQRDKFLDSLMIADHVRGVASHRLATLRSFGIETALDVEYLDHIDKIPDIGIRTIERLMAWRHESIQQFRYNPNSRSQDLIALEQQHRAEVAPLEAKLASGPGRLRELVARMQSRQETTLGQIRLVGDQLHQAEADLAVMELIPA